jgi:hypothetical protein
MVTSQRGNTMEIEVTMRDLYMDGTDTVVLKGRFAELYLSSPYKSNVIAGLETVEFDHPYVIKERILKD